MEYSEQIVKLIAIVVEYLRNNTIEKFSSIIFCIKDLKGLNKKGVMFL